MKRLIKLLLILILLEHVGTVVSVYRSAETSVKELKRKVSEADNRIEAIVEELGFESAQKPSSA